nr:integrase, catalytic region, zinc finger, CCHC-type, peptidase aspartic, catalytic [Tanacetum cinerariifolium]
MNASSWGILLSRELTESLTREHTVIMESIHVNFDELPQMASAHNSSDPAPTCQTMASVQISFDPAPKCQTIALEHDSLSPEQKCQENVSHGDKTGTTSNEMDFLFSPMFDELLNGSSKVVSKSSAVSAADAPNERQQLTTPLNNHTTPAPTCQSPSIETTVISSENINQAEPHAENDEVADDEDGENLDKMKEKGDKCIFVGYSTQSRAYKVYNKRTRVIMESIHVNLDELPQMASVQNSYDLAPTRQSMASIHNSSDPAPTCQKKASVQISSDPAPECQTMASVQISSDPAPEGQTMALEHDSLSPGRK